jgi:hypothetical protein
MVLARKSASLLTQVPPQESHLPTAGLPHYHITYLDKIRYFKGGFLRYSEEGFFKGKEMGLQFRTIKMILYNIIK